MLLTYMLNASKQLIYVVILIIKVFRNHIPGGVC